MNDVDKTVVIPGEDPLSRRRGGGQDVALSPGTLVGEYEIVKRLGAGGCATVYLANQPALRRQVAIKVLRREWLNSDEMIRRFLFEVHAANTVRHPGIVEIFSSGVLPDGRLYLSMEYVEGMNLLAYAKLHGRFTPREACELLEPVCQALSAAHRAGIIHRDLKASNIVVLQRERDRSVKLLDFGIAKFLVPDTTTQAITRLGTRVGTPCAMSPEQVRCEPVDVRSDVYALGILLYNLLVGAYPFDDPDPLQVERMHLQDPPPRPSASASVPPSVDAVVLRCLEKDKERRFPDVASFVAALRAAVGTGPTASVDLQLPAVGLYVEARIIPAAQETVEEEMLDDFAQALDLAEQVMREGGFEVPMVTGSSLLGIQVLSGAPGTQAEQYKASLALAATLYDQLAARPSRDARVHINVSLHLDMASVKQSTASVEVTGGAITRISDWAPQNDVRGLFVTPPYEQALPAELTVRYEPYLKVH